MSTEPNDSTPAAGPSETPDSAAGGTPIDYSPPGYAPPSGPVVAKAGQYFRNARYILTAVIVGFGLYFLYDGYVGYPKENAAWDAAPDTKKAELKKHSDLDILIQKLLGFVLVPGGIALLGRWLYISRGRVRMEDSVVFVPGHPPFHLDDVTKLDKRLWDRKGIAYVEYQTADGKSGRVTLDDFIYERKPIDLIYDAINHNLKERASQTA